MKYVRLYTKSIPTSDRVIQSPCPPRWPKNWEWKLTFTQIFILVSKQFKFWIDKFIIDLVVKRKLSDYQMKYQIEYETVSEIDIEKFVLDALRNNEYQRSLISHKCMIIYGPDAKRKLFSTEIFQTNIRYKFAYNERGQSIYYLHNIPCIYIPTISGMHILPDLTGKWSEEIFIEPALSTFGRKYF